MWKHFLSISNELWIIDCDSWLYEPSNFIILKTTGILFELIFWVFVWSICTLDKYTLGQVLLNCKFLFFYSEFLIWKCFFNKRSKIKLQIQNCLHRNSYLKWRVYFRWTELIKLIFIYICYFYELKNFKADFSSGQKIFSQAIKMFNLGRLKF